MPTRTPRVTPLPIMTPNDLDRSLLDSSLLEGTGLREATSLVNSIIRSSTLKTPGEALYQAIGSSFRKDDFGECSFTGRERRVQRAITST
jgi:hypothetical protein